MSAAWEGRLTWALNFSGSFPSWISNSLLFSVRSKGFTIPIGLLYLPIGLCSFVADKLLVEHCVWQTTDELQFNRLFKEASLTGCACEHTPVYLLNKISAYVGHRTFMNIPFLSQWNVQCFIKREFRMDFIWIVTWSQNPHLKYIMQLKENPK